MRNSHFLGPVLALWAAAAAQGADHDPIQVLRRVTAKVRQTGSRLPNFTCVETVDRNYFHPGAAELQRSCYVILEQRNHPTLDLVLHPYSSDRLRLDVALVKRGEIFSWAGASQFDEDGIDHLVREGPMGTGAFAGFLIVIFTADVKMFTYAREVVVDGRDLMEYSFRVSRENSHYRVRVRTSWDFTGYSGSFQVDPETDEVVHLMVQTDELPAASGMCMTTSYLDYATVPIGSSQFLLPTRVRQHWVDPFGKETDNTTTFSACREYKGESTLIFSEDPATLSAAPPASTPPPRPSVDPLPDVAAGLRLKLELTSPIDTDTAAAGDKFSARLIEPLKDAHSTMVADKGTVVEGRLLRVENFRNPPHLIVVLRPSRLLIKGTLYRLACVRDWEREMQENRRKNKGVEIQLPLRGEERSGVFRFEGSHVVLPKGFRSEWRTVTVPPSTSQR